MNKNKKEEKKKNYLDLYHLQPKLKENIFLRISSCKIAKQAWSFLKEGFQGTEKVK